MIHENVEKIRKAKGVTKTHLAKKLNMSLQGYRYLENGDTRLDAERLKVIAHALGENPAIFFDSELTHSVIEKVENTNKQEVI
ncbi:helix-turn-helix domain-containing protein [Salipaludibacillus aurantiacus]|uniref:Helix-turn-helix n=1 Tax=Salipaludibacillus aurantiacus TaxID=1601833 RepID=A0A1H9U2G1_9BACI|nr:helix-turn-helix transcriptional regulator [Salipaludibacillus aurantiacus]SES03273.1 Helix-turn-helix [Salipaludibacillus aurantiacus]